MNGMIILGKPNSGKSLLFNRLTGLKQKVANFPGATVEIKSGQFDSIELLDFPGIYSLTPMSKDEEIAVTEFKKALTQEKIKAVICTLDITRLERSLVFGLQAQALAHQYKKPIIFALNMMDEMSKKKLVVNVEKMQDQLGSPVIPISAKTLLGLDDLKIFLKNILQTPEEYLPKTYVADKNTVLKTARTMARELGPNKTIILKNQTFLDRFFLNDFFGGLFFLFIMSLLFQSIFTWSEPLMDFVETSIAALGGLTTSFLGDGVLKDFINDALFGGFGSFLVFVPQIFVLTFIIGLLEDSGYLVRATLICHKPLSYFGLSGKSFIPYLSGFACAIPAMMAARSIESPKKRFMTLITIPFIPCSARLPVYALLITALFPEKTFLSGLISYRGFAFFALYLLGIMMALITSAFIYRFSDQKKNDMPMVVELPPYRLPHLKPLLYRSFNAARTFITKAGFVIFSVTVIVWILGYFPNGSGSLETSWLAGLGQWINPVFAPLGVDWRYGVAILASFLAREVFVGTLGTLFGIEAADENIMALSSRIQADGMTLATGIALLVFYAIALQCVSTLAMIKKETASLKITLVTFIGYTILAYGMAVAIKLLLS